MCRNEVCFCLFYYQDVASWDKTIGIGDPRGFGHITQLLCFVGDLVDSKPMETPPLGEFIGNMWIIFEGIPFRKIQVTAHILQLIECYTSKDTHSI